MNPFHFGRWIFTLPLAILLSSGMATGSDFRAKPLPLDAEASLQARSSLNIQTFQDWQIACFVAGKDDVRNKDQTCIIRPHPVLIDKQGGVSSLYGRFLKIPGQSQPSLLFLLHTHQGVLLPAGVELRVDKAKPMRLMYRSCEHDHCKAPFLLTDRIRKEFEQGLLANIIVTTQSNKYLATKISLNGFTTAMNAFVKQTGGL